MMDDIKKSSCRMQDLTKTVGRGGQAVMQKGLICGYL